MITFLSWVHVYLHGGRSQVGVLMLELAIESQASLVTVVGKEWGHVVHFAESSLARLDGEPLPARKAIGR